MAETYDELLTLTLKTHAELGKLIAPATADSICASKLENNGALKFIGAVGLLGFVVVIAHATVKESASLQASSALFLPWLNSFALLGSAILGSAFYSFWTARDYLRTGTFNKQYSQVYLIRFALGIISGFILGGSNLVPQSDADATQYSPQLLAIVGGFSADVVAQILQRIADVLLASIKGSEKDSSKAQADLTIQKKLAQVSTDLNEALKTTDPAELTKNIQNVLNNLK